MFVNNLFKYIETCDYFVNYQSFTTDSFIFLNSEIFFFLLFIGALKKISMNKKTHTYYNLKISSKTLVQYFKNLAYNTRESKMIMLLSVLLIKFLRKLIFSIISNQIKVI